MVTVLIAGNKHLSIPNKPRNSQHKIIYPKALLSDRFPLKKYWKPLGAVAAWQPTFKSYQVIHSFNSIPYTNKPFIVTFESFVPYILSMKVNKIDKFFEQKLRGFLTERLSLDNCQKIIAISEYSKQYCIRLLQANIKLINNNESVLNRIINKIEVIHPNFTVLANRPKKYPEGEIQLTFIGRHFARKGGIVALRLAEKAYQHNFPLTINIVSGLSLGGRHTFPDKNKYKQDLKLLDLPNVIHHRRLPNQEVLNLLSQSHFLLLPTMHDTYGYSVIEGFSTATPAITTNVCALPEFVRDNDNGFLLQLPLDYRGEWLNSIPLNQRTANNNDYWESLDQTYNNLSEQMWQKIVELREKPDKQEYYENLSAGALKQATDIHDAQKVAELFDNWYEQFAQ